MFHRHEGGGHKLKNRQEFDTETSVTEGEDVKFRRERVYMVQLPSFHFISFSLTVI